MTAVTEYSRIELRCPTPAKKLLAVVRSTGKPAVITNDNRLELPCRDCRINVKNISGKNPKMVLHRFNVLGELVESEVCWD